MPLDLSLLNPEQRHAVTHRQGPLLVLAGAGTGKTRVITMRMAALVEEGVAPENILALTFTQKAAGEMRERVAALVGKKAARRMMVGTFHAFGARLLRADVHRLGITNAFTILDEGDQRAQVRRLMREARVDEKRAAVPDVVAAISGLKNDPTAQSRLVGTDAGRVAVQLLEAYDRHLRALGTLDFDDLIQLPIRLMREVPDVTARIQRRFQHVLVDEFQDTSNVQMDFLLGVTGRSRTVCAVGDDDQAIYGWRGAVVEHILAFEKYFPGAQAVALTWNYRSTPDILAAANDVIRNNAHRRPKTLRTPSPPGLPVTVVVTSDEEHEVRHVALDLAKRIQAGVPSERFAILFRTGTQSRPFEAALRVEGIPYVLVGGNDITERREVKDVIAHASLMAGRDDESAFRRVVATPSRGVGAASVDKLVAWARAMDTPVVDAAARATENAVLPRKAAQTLQQVGLRLQAARDAEKKALPTDDPSDALHSLLEDLGYLDMLQAEPDLAKQARMKGSVDLVLRSLGTLATRVAEASMVPSEVESRVTLDEGSALDQLVDRMVLDGRDQDRNDNNEDKRPGVRMMTLHAAKGLEFPVVYLPGWEDGLMPHKRSLEDAQKAAPGPVESDGAGAADDDGAAPVETAGAVRSDPVEEERRLAYVGITRAREELIITRAAARRRYGKLEPRVPSRFLRELPGSVVTDDRTEKPMTEEEKRAHMAEMFKKMREGIGG